MRALEERLTVTDQGHLALLGRDLLGLSDDGEFIGAVLNHATKLSQRQRQRDSPQ
jgi:hypothetical protein